MWVFQALGAVISLAMLAEMKAREAPGLDNGVVIVDGRPGSAARYQDLERSRLLWLDCLLHAQLARTPQMPDFFLPVLAEAAFASTWSALDFWEIETFHKNALHTEISEVANFLQTLKPDRNRPGIFELRDRLRKISGQGESRTEVWAYLIGHWLQTHWSKEPSSQLEHLTELGWSFASFGLNFWTRGQVTYRTGKSILPLVQPFSRSDAFELFGPFSPLEEYRSRPTGEQLVFGSLTATRGLRSPVIWKLESLLGGLPGVTLTRIGHVHRQFAGDDLPEWFEAVEITYEPDGTDLESILHRFWEVYSSQGDLLFYTTPEQERRCYQAWQDFKASQPDWVVSDELFLKPCNWFEAAKKDEQKQALRKIPLLVRTLQKIDLSSSYLATKINAFAAGFGQDEDVVMLAARYGLEDGLTLALRTIRYFANR